MIFLDFDPRFKLDLYYDEDGLLIYTNLTHGTEILESFNGNHSNWRAHDFLSGVAYGTSMELEIEEVHHGVDNEI